MSDFWDYEETNKNNEDFWDYKETVTPDYNKETPTLYGGTEYVPTYEELSQNYKAGKISKDELKYQAQRRLDLDYKEADKDVLNEGIRNTIGGGLVAAGSSPVLGAPGIPGAVGGGLIGLGEGILHHKPALDTAALTGEGALIGYAAGKLPAVGKYLGNTKVGKAVINKAGNLAEKAIGKLSESELGSKILIGAEKLGEVLTKDRQFPGVGRKTPPASTVEPQVIETPARKFNLRDYKKNIKSAKFDNKPLQTVKGSKNNKVWTEVLKNEDNAITLAEREFNDVIQEMAKDPSNLRNPNYVKSLEEKVQKIIDKTPYTENAEFVNSFWDRYAQALDNGMKYNQAKFGTNKNNLFGGEPEHPDWLDKYVQGEKKLSKLPESMRKVKALPEELENIAPEYEVLHNPELASQAEQMIKENPSQVLGRLQSKADSENAAFSALDFETARQTVSNLYAEGRIEEALALTNQISKKASQAGQAVQSLALWSRTTPEGAVRQAQKIINEYNQKAKTKIDPLSEEQAAKIMDMANDIQNTTLGSRENQIATHLLLKELKELVPPSKGGRLRTLQNISLLLNPKTFERNIAGNTIFATMENLATKPLAAGYDSLASLKTGVRTRVQPQLKAYGKGFKQGLKEGAEDVKLGINTRDKLGTRFNLNDRSSFTGVPVLEQLEKALNYSLQVPDRAFYQAAYNESLANQMMAAKVSRPTPEMVATATNDGLEAVYQNNSALGDMVLKARQAFNAPFNINGYGAGDAFIPYAQTPANIAQQSINYSPLGFANVLKNTIEGNQRQATLDAARATVGSGLMGLGAYGTYKGIINPAIEDAQVRRNYAALGISPNTLNLGDYDVSFNQLQPLAGPIAGGTALTDIKDGDVLKALDKSLGSIADLGMLQTVSKYMADRNDYGDATAAVNMLASVPSRFVPSVLKQIADVTDNEKKDTSDRNKLKQAGKEIMAKIPGVEKLLPAKYDILGNPVKKYQTEGVARIIDATLNPVYITKKIDDPTMQKLVNLYETTGDKSVLMPIASKEIRYKDLKGNKVAKQLSSREQNEYQRQLGVINKQLLDDIVNSELYNNLDDLEKINLITTTKRYVKDYVDEKLWNKPSIQKRNLVKRLLSTEKDKMIKEVTKIYKNDVLPIKTQKIYQENFE